MDTLSRLEDRPDPPHNSPVRPETLTATDRALLTAVADRMAELAATPVPPAWRRLDAARHADAVEFGPRYDPAGWFTGGERLEDADAVAIRRSIARLEHRGFLEVTDFGRRHRHLKLTTAGLALAASLADADGDAEPAAAVATDKLERGRPKKADSAGAEVGPTT